MAFKMNKPVWHGTAGHKKALSSIKLNRSMDNSSMPDGRPKSSAFQKKADEKITWDEEKLVSEKTEDKEGGGTKTTKDYETEGTSVTPPKKTKEGDEAYEKMTPAERKAADEKYIKGHTKKHKKTRQETSETDPEKPKEEIIKIPKKEIKPIPVDKTKTPKLKTVEVPEETPKKKKRRKKKYKFGDITKGVVKWVGDKAEDIGDNISRARHMRRNRVGRRRRRSNIGCPS